MIERQFVNKNIDLFLIKEYLLNELPGVGLANIRIKKTPLGDKIILTVQKPGIVIGKKGETIKRLTRNLQSEFSLDKPEIELKEVQDPWLNADVVAERVKENLKRLGAKKFKMIAHREIQNIMNAGALGCEIVLTGRIPAQRSKRWRFREGYLKKSGQIAIDGVKTCITTAILNVGSIGVQVRIMPKNLKLPDYVEIYENPMSEAELAPKIKKLFKETAKETKKATKKKTAKKTTKKATKKAAKKTTKKAAAISKEEA